MFASIQGSSYAMKDLTHLKDCPVFESWCVIQTNDVVNFLLCFMLDLGECD